MSRSIHSSELIQPYPHDPSKPICIRVFLNDDGTQFGADMVATWGASPPFGATTVVNEQEFRECDGCGSFRTIQHQIGTRWVLLSTQKLVYGDGVVAFYRKEVES